MKITAVSVGKGAVKAALLCSVFLVTGCQTTGLVDGFGTASPPKTSVVKADMVGGFGSVETTKLANAALTALSAGDFATASKKINAALRLDITNPRLQFLNGLTYHMMALEGDATKLQLAEQGYTLALKFDPTNVTVKRHLAQLYIEEKRFGEAERLLAGVAIYRPNDPDILYNLAAAAYYNHDPETADAALTHLVKVAPARAKTTKVLFARAMVRASLDDQKDAKQALDTLRTIAPRSPAVPRLEQRVRNWADFYKFDAHTILAQFAPPGGGNAPYGGNGGGTAAPAPYGGDAADPYGAAGQTAGQGPAGQSLGTQDGAAFADGRMVVVDVVLIGMQSDIRNARGINLLNGLQLQFGDPTAGTAAFSFGTTKIWDHVDSTNSTDTETITKLISIPAVTYSLNIANDSNSRDEILAKPSLVAQNGQTSEFFSGTEVTAAAVSGGAGDSVSVQKEVGVKLAVTPEFLPDGKIRLHVVAERTFLTDPSKSVVFQFRLDTSKTNINSTVTMNFGETLILGGLSESETARTSDATPVLGDVPILNYLFNARAKRKFRHSILLLLTPRRPAYTHESAKHRAETLKKMSAFELDLERLHRRYRDWFTPRPTFNELLQKIQGQEFFREFKTGDIKVDSWYSPQSLSKQVANLKNEMAN